jgi:hypothetical protein
MVTMIPGMEQFEAARVRLWRLSGWQTALLLALAVAVVLAMAVVATTLVLVITPIVLVALVANRLLAGRSARRDAASPAGRFQVIEGEYEIISSEPAADRPPPESGEDRRRPE